MASEITNQIQALIEKTREGKINWQQVGSNVFRWIRTTDDGQAYTVTLQSNPIGFIPTAPSPQGTPPQVKQLIQYILTIQSNKGGELILQLQTHMQLNQIYYPLLQQLMGIINEKTDLKSSEILNKILDKL